MDTSDLLSPRPTPALAYITMPDVREQAHRLQVKVLIATADEDVPRVKDDEVVEVGGPGVGVGSSAVQRI